MNKEEFCKEAQAKLDIEGSVEISGNGPDFTVSISSRESCVDFNFDFLLWLSEIFQTRKINIGNRYSTEGCDTCGWGSRHYVSIYVLESPKAF